MFGKDKHTPEACRALRRALRMIEIGKSDEAMKILTDHKASSCLDYDCGVMEDSCRTLYRAQAFRHAHAQTLRDTLWIEVEREIQLGNFVADGTRIMLDQLLAEAPASGLERAIRALITCSRFGMGRGEYDSASVTASRALLEIDCMARTESLYWLRSWTHMWYIIAHSYAGATAEEMQRQCERYFSMNPPQRNVIAVTAVLHGSRPQIQELLAIPLF